MRRARGGALMLIALLAAAPGPALAHKLKVFAAPRGDEIVGYAFFVGGGRPSDVPFEIATPAGDRIGAGRTDAEGGFRWPLPGPGDYVVTVNAEDGHVARARLPAARIATVAADPAPPSAPRAVAPDEAEIAALVAAAVQREILPLREEIAAMDSRLRLTDIVSGVFLILGAAGGVLWRRGGGGRP